MPTEAPRHPSQGDDEIHEPPADERKIIPVTHTQWSTAHQDRCKHCERPIFLDNFDMEPENPVARWRHVNQELDNPVAMELRGIKHHEADLKPHVNPYGERLTFSPVPAQSKASA